MLRMQICLFLFLCLLLGNAHGQERFEISGEVTLQYDGDVYICLFTKEGYKSFDKELPSPPYLQIVKMNPDIKKSGKTSFSFGEMPKGTYGIVAFQDTVKNGKFDWSAWTGTTDEPFGCYRALPVEVSVPNWDSIKFELNENMKGIEINM